MRKCGVSSVCSAFSERTVGTKVLDREEFFRSLDQALDEYDSSKDRVPGQHFVVLPASAFSAVSAGDGPASQDPDDYVVRKHREGPALFLRRDKAGKVAFLAVVVYTMAAYAADPEVSAEEVAQLGDATHVVVAVLASAGPKAPRTPWRFVMNLAGGNRESLVASADELRAEASEIAGYWKQWSVVSD
jgi:hypothetical protein